MKTKILVTVLGICAAIWGVIGYTSTHMAGSMYRNDQYGFSMSIPDSWKGYHVISQDSFADGPNQSINGQHHIDFCLPDDKGNNHCILTIHVYSKTFWENIPIDERDCNGDACTGLKIGENNSYVFAWSWVQDLPPELDKAFNDKGKMIETFRSLK